MTGTQPTQTDMSDPEPGGIRGRVARLTESAAFRNAITAVIAANAVTLGLETSATVMSAAGPLLVTLDRIFISIFTAEILLKLIAQRIRFFRSGWNVFDFIIVAISLVPTTGTLSVLRALRILRAMRLFSAVPRFRRIIEAFLDALPGMGGVVGILLLIFYIGAVLSTKLFGEQFPQWFGTIGESMYSLFQIMTLESWSMGIVRPVMEVYPFAWAFFVPFIVVTSFAVLNLFIGIIVGAMQSQHDAEASAERQALNEAAHGERTMILEELRALRADVAALQRDLQDRAGEDRR